MPSGSTGKTHLASIAVTGGDETFESIDLGY
jgi:hypothetical protein